ncbi:hypothetical protein ACFQ69_32925 [Streptomyces sp. NPDC056470]|uniref:hypothetical protein n=1 Tax=Streptomyces sp. NPDC056470 TaxID=3345831 RepID=UPI003684384E
MSRVTGSSGAGASSLAVCSGRRSATAVRIAPRLTRVAGEGGDGASFQVRGAHVGSLPSRDGGAASALGALGLGGAQSVVGELALEVALEFAGGGEGLHHERLERAHLGDR